MLVVVAHAFAWSMGTHYTGACMGMPYATKSIALRPALRLMAIMTLLGAVFLSGRVLTHVGHGIITGRLPVNAAIIVIGVAFALTTLFTQMRVPTSTIQILVFALIGTALPLGLRVEWAAILHLAILRLLAPLLACGLGWLFTRLFDQIRQCNAVRTRTIAGALVAVGGLASLTMGANDVSNATAVVLTWGRPLLEPVAFDIAKMDMGMATAAQSVQALVVMTAVTFGYVTSMNQALIGAMAGTGLARGRHTIDNRVLSGIARGWVIGPGATVSLAYGAAWTYHAILHR